MFQTTKQTIYIAQELRRTSKEHINNNYCNRSREGQIPLAGFSPRKHTVAGVQQQKMPVMQLFPAISHGASEWQPSITWSTEPFSNILRSSHADRSGDPLRSSLSWICIPMIPHFEGILHLSKEVFRSRALQDVFQEAGWQLGCFNGSYFHSFQLSHWPIVHVQPRRVTWRPRTIPTKAWSPKPIPNTIWLVGSSHPKNMLAIRNHHPISDVQSMPEPPMR